MYDDKLTIRQIEDIVRYDSSLKLIRFIYRGFFYDATVASAGVEPLPRPDMYSAIWITTDRVHPVKLDSDFADDFVRKLSIAILYPKALSISAEARGSLLAPILSGTSPLFHQDDGVYFAGMYDNKGGKHGLFIDLDGNLLLRGGKGSITIGKDGISIDAKQITLEGRTKSYLPFKKTGFSFIPHTIPTIPVSNPIDAVDLDMIDKMKSKFLSVLNILKI